MTKVSQIGEIKAKEGQIGESKFKAKVKKSWPIVLGESIISKVFGYKVYLELPE